MAGDRPNMGREEEMRKGSPVALVGELGRASRWLAADPELEAKAVRRQQEAKRGPRRRAGSGKQGGNRGGSLKEESGAEAATDYRRQGARCRGGVSPSTAACVATCKYMMSTVEFMELELLVMHSWLPNLLLVANYLENMGKQVGK